MKVLVLGGHGFVGTHVCETFRSAGHQVTALSRRDGVDLTDLSAARDALERVRPEAIVNCAAVVGSLNFVTQAAATVFDQNMRMLLNLYNAASQALPKVVLVNPVANCAFPGHLIAYREENFWDGPLHQSVFSYGNTRRMMLVLSDCYRMQNGLRSVNFFVPNMYGPRDSTDPNKAHALNALAGKIVKARQEGRKTLEVWGTGVAVREWLYVGDFARVVLEALHRLDEQHFDTPRSIAQNDGWSVQQIVERLVRETGYMGEVVWDRTKPDGAPRKVMDDALFRKAFPDFKFTDFTEGVRQTIRYYESIYPY